MKKFFTILLVFSLLQVGFAYAVDTSTANLEDRDYIFGISKQSDVNLNQVLFLLAGKDGEPGAAGRDGIDGINGLDGKDGKDGQNGVDGRDGIDGINGKDGINGINGTNGINGINGKDGKDGKDGRDGAGATGTTTESYTAYSNGLLNILACTESATVTLRPKYTGEDFVFENASFKDVATRCGDGTKDVTLYFKIGNSPLHNLADPKYINGDIVKCVYPIPLSSTWGNPQFTATNAATPCSTVANPGTIFRFNDIYTADFTNKVGFEIYAR